MCNALFSIRPEYAEKILSGKKCFEFRTIQCRREIRRIVIYVPMPVSQIVGEAEVLRIVKAPPDVLWEKVQGAGGISKANFDAYFRGRSVAVAYQLEQPMRYQNASLISDLGIKRPPQSFCYLSEAQYKLICSLCVLKG